ncbi:hypothetical protein L9F63_024987, partial [Diploptera punctata]
PGCQIAGFLTVFASELSIYTLTVITSERWYAITYALHLERRLRLSTAGWLYAITMATLPLLGISGYSKTSICLPMENRDLGDQVYLVGLLLVNGLAFILICACYSRIYCAISGHNSTAAQSDTTYRRDLFTLLSRHGFCTKKAARYKGADGGYSTGNSVPAKGTSTGGSVCCQTPYTPEEVNHVPQQRARVDPAPSVVDLQMGLWVREDHHIRCATVILD